MTTTEELIHSFYTAFQKLDYESMQRLYHDDARFSDPVFQDLNAEQVRSMWKMLLTTGRDLSISYDNVRADSTSGSCRWEAYYNFSKTGRSVHNIIHATFEFKDGKIFRHYDRFDLWRWSRQALGITGMLLGWSVIVKKKVRRLAASSLDKYMASQEPVRS